MATSTTERRSPAASNLLRFYLALLLSVASKVIVKHAGGGVGHRDGGGASSYRCRTCDRVFPTFQALGGHRTSHKRPRVRAHGLDLLLGARPGRGSATDDVHRCNTCGAVFPTGQALGGHMRRHRAAALFDDVGVTVPGETTTARVVDLSSEEQQGESDDDDAGAGQSLPIRLIQFI